jgi:hypothetical protein
VALELRRAVFSRGCTLFGGLASAAGMSTPFGDAARRIRAAPSLFASPSVVEPATRGRRSGAGSARCLNRVRGWHDRRAPSRRTRCPGRTYDATLTASGSSRLSSSQIGRSMGPVSGTVSR